MVLRLKTTALLIIELACEPMNQTVVSLGVPALREVRLLRSGRQCIVMFLCGRKHSSVLTHMEAGGRKISDGRAEKREAFTQLHITRAVESFTECESSQRAPF